MQILSGKYRGRRLSKPPEEIVRPTSSLLRAALFNICRPVDGWRVLDLCAGSGAIGIEALSLGAAYVLFVEKHPRVAVALHKSLSLLGVPPEQSSVWVQCALQAVDQLAKKIAARVLTEPFDLIYIDPPYHVSTDGVLLAVALLYAVDRVEGLLTPSGRVFLEISNANQVDSLFAEPLRTLQLKKLRSYGSTALCEFHSINQ